MDADTFKKDCLPYGGNFFRVAYRLLENAGDAEDVVQDVYEKLWSLRDSLSAIRNVEAYGVRITRNLCLDKLRSAAYNVETCSAESLKVEFPEETNGRDLSNDVKTIWKIAASLPYNQRKVFRLRYYNGCSPSEIEKITGLGSVNIRVLLSRARKSVRDIFNEESK
ncbi:MAG: RNA polymerase sigma factor [Bacteroidales bacterium]|jgi:RNA polymerase sigma-70 factor (ECF subfamily)|nr:RNA polymerase sigma factor [Bacteroidales bacterium]